MACWKLCDHCLSDSSNDEGGFKNTKEDLKEKMGDVKEKLKRKMTAVIDGL